jgi:hypothetical protein
LLSLLSVCKFSFLNIIFQNFYCKFFETRSHYLIQANLEFAILLPPLHKCWYYRHMPLLLPPSFYCNY